MPRDTSVKKSWRQRMYQIKKPFNPEFELKKEPQPTPDDIIFKHPENGANIRIKDNGTIQIFADDNTGIKIDPNSGSIQHFSDKSIFQSEYINFHTDEKGLRWNYQPFNYNLANPFREVITTIPGGAKILEKLLTSPGTYLTTAGPTSPGTISGISSLNLGNEQVYEGIEAINRTKALAKGIYDSIKSFNLTSLEGVN